MFSDANPVRDARQSSPCPASSRDDTGDGCRACAHETSRRLQSSAGFHGFSCEKILCRLRRRFLFQRSEDAFENPFAVVAAKEWFAGAFGMWHQPGHVAAFVAN